MFGLPSSLPIFVAPAALARLGHPDGEMNLTRAAGAEGILQGVRVSILCTIHWSSPILPQISSNSSCSMDEIMAVKRPDQNLIFQVSLTCARAVRKTWLIEMLILGSCT